MKTKVFSLIMALALSFTTAVPAMAAEVTKAEVPVTLTVINAERKISVTVPAALPVSVVDGDVVTATNAAITNEADSGSIRVTAVTVNPVSYSIGDFDDFSGAADSIALEINGCPTKSAGPLELEEDAFPDIVAGTSLSIQYDAKVSASEKVSSVTAATVVFTISAVENGGA